MSEDTPIYYGTSRVRLSSGTSGALVIAIGSYFKIGDKIHITIWRVDEPSRKVVSTKRVCIRGANSRCVYLDKKWGFERDELVCYRMRLAEDGDPDETD